MKLLTTNSQLIKKIENQVSYEHIKKDSEFVQKEILEARSAFRKYVINNNIEAEIK